MAFMNRIEKLHRHITALIEDPTLPLDSELLGAFDRDVTDTLPEDDHQSLLNQLSSLIPTLQQDPKPATELILNLIRPKTFTFARVLSIQPNVDLVAGLSSTNPDINLVVLHLVEKACSSSGEAGIIAASPEIVVALVKLWLCTTSTEVASKGLETLNGLLRVDATAALDGDTNIVGFHSKLYGQGLMWRRVFHDRDVYELFFSICSLTTAGQPGQPTKREKTIAQSRLLDFVLRFSIFDQISNSQLPDIEKRYGVKNGGLLEFAAVHMVDYRDDVLMAATLIDFYANFLRGDAVRSWDKTDESDLASSEALQFLISKGLHSHIMSYYLEPDSHDSLESTYLFSPSAQYVATYASYCSSHFLQQDQGDALRVLHRLSEVLEQTPKARWAHGNAPRADLHVLSSLPRITLLPLPHASSHSPLFSIPIDSPSADALNTLAAVFRGPSSRSSSSDKIKRTNKGGEAAAARALYLYYMKLHPDLWQRVVSVAEIIAIKENALAAINLMDAVIGAYWEPLPVQLEEESGTSFSLPIEAELERQFPQRDRPLPIAGTIAILSGSAQTNVIPYLLKPAQNFGRGDAQSAAYAVAVAKQETVIHLHRKLREASTIPEFQLKLSQWQPIIDEIGQCATRGVWGGSSAVGGRVGTLEL
ncbi:hypothetical protein MMC13_002655 [Lambiella insularis]|nr:hypothetical protein [Lambiella insularis]